MSTENSLDRLLAVNEMHSLYLALGTSMRTDIDIENSSYDLRSVRNTIYLLSEVGLIGHRFGRYGKRHKTSLEDIESFKSDLFTRITEFFEQQVKDIFSCDVHYDELRAIYYLKRNSVKLELSGLLMLLDSLGVVTSEGANVYINDSSLLADYKAPAREGQTINIAQLKHGLAIKEALGAEAEQLAYEFELKRLVEQGIDKQPMIVSSVDVSAGYDIVSYLHIDSTMPDKFIEVKSCAGHDYQFYISRNEIETARAKRETYFLYLYNRDSNQFRIVQNPYDRVFEGDDWAKESEVVAVHAIQ